MNLNNVDRQKDLKAFNFLDFTIVSDEPLSSSSDSVASIPKSRRSRSVRLTFACSQSLSAAVGLRLHRTSVSSLPTEPAIIHDFFIWISGVFFIGGGGGGTSALLWQSPSLLCVLPLCKINSTVVVNRLKEMQLPPFSDI